MWSANLSPVIPFHQAGIVKTWGAKPLVIFAAAPAGAVISLRKQLSEGAHNEIYFFREVARVTYAI
jgi:hypothetical protein